MNRPDLQERVQTLEDEVAALESMLDARTRTLWREVEKLQAGVKDLQERLQVQVPHNKNSAESARR